MAERVEENLARANLKLPQPTKPIAVYVPAVKTGNLLFVSGHGPLRADRTLICGRLGADMTVEQGREAAQVTALNLLASVKASLGSLDKVRRVVKVFGLVRCTSEFTEQPRVIDGFTEVMRTAFGEERGVPARSAVGTDSLPAGIAVEVEAIFECD